MYLKNPIYLGLTGTTLIVSNLPWLINPNKKTTISESTQDSIVFRSLDDVNSYDPEDPNTNISPKTRSADYRDKSFLKGSEGVYILPASSSQKFYLHKPNNPLNDFLLKFFATEEDYSSIQKLDIKIELFKSSAWNSDSFNDEYSSLEKEKITELFDELDELKTKQLLLSLSIRRDWKKSSNNDVSVKLWANDLNEPESVDDLKRLKIKYFQDFKDLKEYVQTKVKSCTGEKKSCIAREKELSIPDPDKLSFFDNTDDETD